MMTNGMITLTHWGLLEITGPDAKTFLQGQITCHMDNVTPVQGVFAGHCNLKGRLQSLFQIIQIENEAAPCYLLIMPREMISPTKQQFKKYALFSKVSFSEKSEAMPLIGICSDNNEWSTLAPNACLTQSVAAGNYTVIRLQDDLPRFIIVCHSLAVYETLFPALQQNHSMIASGQWEAYDIAAKLPTLYPQTIDTTLPHHANLVALGGISFDKGCYLGQEIIARMHYKGKIKKHLYVARVESPTAPLPGAPITVANGNENLAPGLILRVASNATNHQLLVVIDDEEAKSGSLQWENYPVTFETETIT